MFLLYGFVTLLIVYLNLMLMDLAVWLLEQHSTIAFVLGIGVTCAIGYMDGLYLIHLTKQFFLKEEK